MNPYDDSGCWNGLVTSIRYARSGDVRIAYHQFGAGEVDMVGIPPFAQNIELMWERPQFVETFDRMGRFARIVHFDKRGTGMSDRGVGVPTLDQRVDDTRAVMDAAGVDRAVLCGLSEGGPMAIAFARTYPERVAGLVLIGTAAHLVDDDESADDAARRRASYVDFVDRWGTDRSQVLALFAPSALADPDYVSWEPRYERQSASPGNLAELLGMLDHIDVRPMLADIDVPTLVVHRTGDRVAPIERARAMAAAIPGAIMLELDGIDHFAHFGDTSVWLDAVEQFVTRQASSNLPTRSSATLPTEIRLFGGFVVRRNGVEVPTSEWGSRRSRQLCQRLAIVAGSPVSREQLFEELWPNDPAPIGRLGARLSVLLSTVRRILGGGVVADRSTIRLDPKIVRVDLVEFDAAIAAGRFAEAVKLHRGPLLPEEPYDDHIAIARVRTHLRYLGALQHLARHATSKGRHQEAVSYAFDWTDAEPLDQTANDTLVAALLALNRPRDATVARDTHLARMAELDDAATPSHDHPGRRTKP